MNKMKMRNISIILAISSCLAFMPPARATVITTNASGGMTITIPAEQPVTQTATSFFDSAASYLTTFNQDYTWTNVTLEASIGYKQVTGSGANSVLTVQYDIGRFNVGSTMQFQGAGSAVGVLGAQVGYALIEHYDAKLDFDLQGGYSWYQVAGYIEPGLYVDKKLTSNTFARIGLSLPVYSKGTFNRNPSFEVSLGFTY